MSSKRNMQKDQEQGNMPIALVEIKLADLGETARQETVIMSEIEDRKDGESRNKIEGQQRLL